MNPEVQKYYTLAILKQACAQFAINPEKVKLIQGNANLVFDGGDKVLRLSHSCLRSRVDLESEIDWLQFLKGNRLPVVGLVRSQTKEFVVQIGDTDNHFSVVCFEKIIGPKVSDAGWNAAHFKKLGTLAGRLHRVGQQYQEKRDIVYLHWNEIVEFGAWKYLPDDKRNLLALHDQLVETFLNYPKTDANYGLIHYDIHQGNYLLSGEHEALILFDFEMTCKSWYTNDIATILHYASHHPISQQTQNFDQFFLHHFWQGYEKEYSIPAEERLQIPKFVLYRNLLVYGFIHRVFPHEESRKSVRFLFDRYRDFIELRRGE